MCISSVCPLRVYRRSRKFKEKAKFEYKYYTIKLTISQAIQEIMYAFKETKVFKILKCMKARIWLT